MAAWFRPLAALATIDQDELARVADRIGVLRWAELAVCYPVGADAGCPGRVFSGIVGQLGFISAVPVQGFPASAGCVFGSACPLN